MDSPEREWKDRMAYLALFYAIKGQVRKSEQLRRLIRKIDQPTPATVSG